MSRLKKALTVELSKAPDDLNLENQIEFENPSDFLRLNLDDLLLVRIKNNSSINLNITALVLQPDWSISQIYPYDQVSLFEEFKLGQEDIIILKASLPNGYQNKVDIIKVFATVSPTNFRWLELPVLDHLSPSNQSRNLDKPANSLEDFFSIINSETQSLNRNLTPASSLKQEWVTNQVMVSVSK